MPALLNAPSALPARRVRCTAQSASPRRSVDATSPATSTRALAPNSTPLGLSSQTWPLLDRLPKISEGSLPSTRLSTLLAASGWAKCTVLPAPMENCCQFNSALAELVTVSRLALAASVAWPCTTCRPVGSAGPAAWPGSVTTTPASARASASGRSVSGVVRRSGRAAGRPDRG